MKNIIILFCLTLFVVSNAVAQKRFLNEYNSNNCVLNNNLKVSKAAIQLIDTYKNLVAATGNLCTSSNGTITNSSTMPLPYYGGSGAAGTISFSCFIESGNLFRTVFGSKQSEYDYYGACAPKPIVWDASPNGVNHVFASKLVTMQNFVAAGLNADFSKFTAVNIADINDIDCVKMEEKNGYAAITETANYNNRYSSKGILVKVIFKSGDAQYCYLINNYDTSGTLKWKE
jgi:hypothetical protein